MAQSSPSQHEGQDRARAGVGAYSPEIGDDGSVHSLNTGSRARPPPPKRGNLLPDSSRKGKSAETIVPDAPTVQIETAKSDARDSHPAETARSDASESHSSETARSAAPNPSPVETPAENNVPQAAPPTAYLQTDSFFVFAWLDGASRSDIELVNSEVIRDHLEEVDDWLRRMTSFGDAKAYKACRRSSRSLVRHCLKDEGRELQDVKFHRGGYGNADQNHFENLIDIFNAADTIFQFFLPVDFEGPTVGKYWGAINDIIFGVSFLNSTLKTGGFNKCYNRMMKFRRGAGMNTHFTASGPGFERWRSISPPWPNSSFMLAVSTARESRCLTR